MDAIQPVVRPAKVFLGLLKKLLKYYLAYRFFRVWFPRKVRSLKGATVLVTGAAGGVGASVCRECAKRGASKLILWDINEAGASAVAEELRKQAVYKDLKDVKVQKVNLASKTEIYEAAKQALADAGGCVDVVVNNAGMITGEYLLQSDDRRNELTMNINTMAHFYTTKAFLPAMLDRAGGDRPRAAFLNVVSMASYIGTAQMVDYACSKFAARGFSEALSQELKQLGLWDKCRVSCICPGPIKTELFKGFHIRGAAPVTADFVAARLADAYECDQELVLLPRHMAPSIILIGIAQSLGFYGLPNPDQRVSPLANFDSTQAESIWKRLGV
eukprot:TRINITY_DN17269_c0_g1_i1.p1 TRINITY_DN17269_c0_g1~~TRINITY_DN17269_c0_g1_i1.p1  ORF type:complete len:358 (-),score=60.73 TRINITY_DN17269_c0_g1_i1:122-1111(-)